MWNKYLPDCTELTLVFLRPVYGSNGRTAETPKSTSSASFAPSFSAQKTAMPS